MKNDNKSVAVKKSSVAASGLVSGGVALGLTLFMAITANSISLWADSMATLIDFLAIFFAWWGLKKTEAGRAEAYNYGFGRFESLISMGMAVMMALSFVCILTAAIIRFLNPVPLQGMGVLTGIAAHLIFGGINIRLLRQSRELEQREKTAILSSQCRIYTMKIIANILVFASLAVAYFLRDFSWSSFADPIAATAIAATLLAGASKMFKFSVLDLLDCAIEERFQLFIIRSLALHFDQYEQIHDIRTRIAGGKVYVEVFLEFSPQSQHGSVMTTIHSLQQEIRDALECSEVLIIPVCQTGAST